MSRYWIYFLIVLGEVLFFILDQWMKRHTLTAHVNPGLITQWIPMPLISTLGVVVVLVCVLSIVRAFQAQSFLSLVSLIAVLLGVTSNLLDLWRVHAFVDWIYITTLAFNGGDILIIGGILGILGKFQMTNFKDKRLGFSI